MKIKVIRKSAFKATLTTALVLIVLAVLVRAYEKKTEPVPTDANGNVIETTSIADLIHSVADASGQTPLNAVLSMMNGNTSVLEQYAKSEVEAYLESVAAENGITVDELYEMMAAEAGNEEETVAETQPQVETSVSESEIQPTEQEERTSNYVSEEFIASLPAYDGTHAYYVLGKSNFSEYDKWHTDYYQNYVLNEDGRCGRAIAVVSYETMPTGERGDISAVHPSGWKQAEYPNIISETYLYNRCHLIGWQLTGQNANEANLITGTRYFNVEGMLPNESKVAEAAYMGDKILYSVEPLFVGNEQVARGVLMMAYSINDNGKDVDYTVWVPNVQPGIKINYSDGSSQAVQ